jgi:excisionase family DNA binding protein
MVDTLSGVPRIPPGMVPLQQAARELGISRVTIHRWIRDGKLKSYEADGVRYTLLNRAELEDFLRRGVREKKRS